MTANRRRQRDDAGMTMIELLVTSSVLLVLLGMVFASMNLIEGVSSGVSAQFQEFNQALPALAPLQQLIAAEIEPAPPVPYSPANSGVPTPAFESIGNFSMTFYSNIGTAHNNTVSCPSSAACAGTTAGPAKIVAQVLNAKGNPVLDASGAPQPVLDAQGNPVLDSDNNPTYYFCTTRTPCSFQVRMYLPRTDTTAVAGVSSCPFANNSADRCQYSASYRLIANVQYVVNNVDVNAGSVEPLFTYNIFDPGGTVNGVTYTDQGITLSSAEVQSGLISARPALGYPSQPVSTCIATATTATPPQPIALTCPTDAIQSVTIDLKLNKPGSGSNGSVENQLTIYRYAMSPGATSYPYQYSESAG